MDSYSLPASCSSFGSTAMWRTQSGWLAMDKPPLSTTSKKNPLALWRFAVRHKKARQKCELDMDVLYTSAKTLWTVANVDKWHQWILLLWWRFASQLSAYRRLLCWTVYDIFICAWARSDITDDRTYQQGRGEEGAIVLRHGTKPSNVVGKHP